MVLFRKYTGNKGLHNKHRFEVFDERSAYIVIISFLTIALGYYLYIYAIKSHADELNGILLIAFGICGLLYMVYSNIKQSNIKFGLGVTIVQFILYVPITCGVFILLLGLFAAASDAKPVYRIDR